MSHKPKDHTIPKACRTCNEVKPPECYYPVKRAKNRSHLPPGRLAHCIPCYSKNISAKKSQMGEEWHKIENERKKKWVERNLERNSNNLWKAWLKRAYNITPEDYEALFNQQDGRCAICNEAETRVNKVSGMVKKLAVDHCHTTGRVRGLLCFACNGSLGKFKDSIEILKRAIEYLKKDKDEEVGNE